MNSVNSINFSSTGELLAAGFKEKLIKIWNVKTFKEEKILRGH